MAIATSPTEPRGFIVGGKIFFDDKVSKNFILAYFEIKNEMGPLIISGI
jgi:hypothetical protein